MNGVKSFDCLIIEEFLALFIDRFESIIEDLLDRFDSFLDLIIDRLYLDVPREELGNGVQLKDQVADFFDLFCWALEGLDIFLKVIHGLDDLLFNELLHLIDDEFNGVLMLQLF